MITPIPAFSRQWFIASIISVTVSGVNAFLTLGLLMLILAIPLCCWNRISLYSFIVFQLCFSFIHFFHFVLKVKEDLLRLRARGFKLQNPGSAIHSEEGLQRRPGGGVGRHLRVVKAKF